MPKMTSERMAALMVLANELAFQCPPSSAAFSVGAVLTNAAGDIIATGYSRELGEAYHAEQVAIEKAADRLDGELVIFSSLEPCSIRLSGRRPCCSILIESGVKTVIVAAREPSTFVAGKGCEILTEHGIEVIMMEEFQGLFQKANEHLLNLAIP